MRDWRYFVVACHVYVRNVPGVTTTAKRRRPWRRAWLIFVDGHVVVRASLKEAAAHVATMRADGLSFLIAGPYLYTPRKAKKR